jgi:hypothetical protein
MDNVRPKSLQSIAKHLDRVDYTVRRVGGWTVADELRLLPDRLGSDAIRSVRMDRTPKAIRVRVYLHDEWSPR